MIQKVFRIQPSDKVESCPICGNKTEFQVLGDQHTDPTDYDIWITCGRCDYDPSIFSQMRHKSAWGEINSIEELQELIDLCWNRGIKYNADVEIDSPPSLTDQMKEHIRVNVLLRQGLSDIAAVLEETVIPLLDKIDDLENL